MTKNNVTLKEIAQEVGVSTTTVHRVLTGKEGCGDELKMKILAVARQMGYTVNLSASSLRKKTVRIALVFPSGEQVNRFFMARMLEGYRRFQENLDPYNVQFLEYIYDYDDPDSMCPILRGICMDDPVKIDGIALWGITTSRRVTDMLNRLQGKGVPVVMLERAPSDPELYDCCVGPDEDLVGAMAGELVSKLTRRSGKVLVVTQKFGYPDPNGVSCARMLEQMGRTDLEPVILELPLMNYIWEDRVREALVSMEHVVAVYATCARHTLAVVRAVKALDYSLDCAIGSEVYQESMEALEDGTLSAVVNKCPNTMGYQAHRLLFERVVKNEALPKEYHVIPQIVLRSNMRICQND